MKTDRILTYSFKDITDQEIWIEKYIATNCNKELLSKPVHRRADHFLFIFQKRGKSKIMVDFTEIELIGSVLLCVLPGQIHYAVSLENLTEACLITLDIQFVNGFYRNFFEEHYSQYQPKPLKKLQHIKLNNCIELISSIKEEQKHLNFIPQAVHSLIDACVGIFASIYIDDASGKQEFNLPRHSVITKEFKQLLLKEFKTHKSTSDYATLLNITPSYLNEAVKLATGFTVSYWIKQAVVTEAKRLLYATGNTVKEIAYSLGFEDHAYFNRYFSKAEGQSPLKFRSAYRQ